MNVQVVMVVREENGGFRASFPDFPECTVESCTLDGLYDKAADALVEHIARLVIEGQQLMSLAKQANTPPAGSLDEEHQGVRANLEKLSGRPFDLAYIDGQIQDHQKTAQLLEWEIGSGQDPALKKFASEALPTVLQHLRLAQDLKTQLTGGGPQGVSASATGGSGALAPPGAGAPSGIKR